jgi:hypothetical protein
MKLVPVKLQLITGCMPTLTLNGKMAKSTGNNILPRDINRRKFDFK